ncbi:MAG: hypothetical protein R3E93_04530 [Thiothrix sp.]
MDRKRGSVIPRQQRGMYLHPTLCVTPERLPLGITDTWMVTGLSKPPTRPTRQGKPPTEGYERVAELQSVAPSTASSIRATKATLCAAQRAQQLDYPADLLIRAQHNRALGTIADAIDQQSLLTRITFTKPRKPGEKPRKATEITCYTCAPKASSRWR